ncbi:MAG: hypothetical protein ABI605_19415 [Rhizobacter sp.]
MKPLTVYTPDQLSSSMPPDLSFAAYRFLAEGDSWFTLSTLNPARNSNLPRAQRLLLSAAEWAPASDGPQRYLCAEGWQTFSDYLQANFSRLLGMRDEGPSANCPAFVHGYACPTPRDAGAGFGLGPWLMPSLQSHGIPVNDWIALAALLIHQLGGLLAVPWAAAIEKTMRGG